MAKATRIRLLPCLAAILVLAPTRPAGAGSSAFTYQGQIKFEGTPINGDCDLQFMLFDGFAAVNPIAQNMTNTNNVPVKIGLFTVQLDFGASAFPGADRWLEVAARCPAGGGAFETFVPRQPVTTVPYAIRAMNANVLDAPGGGPVDVRGDLTLEAGHNPILYTSASSGEQNRYLLLINSPSTATASGLKAGGLLVADSYDFWQPGKNHLVVKGNVGIGIGVSDSSSRLSIAGQDALDITGYQPFLTMSDSAEPGPLVSPALYRLQAASGHWALLRRPRCRNLPCAGFAEIINVDSSGIVGIGTGLDFGNRGGQLLSLWGSNGSRRFGIGIQAETLYSRVGNGAGDGFAWYKGGSHSDSHRDPGGGLALMTLDEETGLVVNNKTTTRVLEITGGGDLAEPFRIAPRPGRAVIEPGMVVVIDPHHPGDLALSSAAYDRRVAGVISGANGLSPGMVMAARGDASADGDHPVALTGRVWTRCEAKESDIEPGDMLTTSDTPGHAMKVADHARAQGAVLGKAMTRLARGETGVVLTLVSLQ